MINPTHPDNPVRGEAAVAAGPDCDRERFFRQLVDSSLDIIGVLDEHGVIRFENRASERLLGYRLDERIGRSAFGSIHPDDRAAALEVFKGLLARPDQTASTEFRYQNKDGSWRHLAVVAKNLLHEPDVAGVIVNSRDVTQQKQVETKRRDARIEHMAFRDALTGLSNRVELHHRLEQAVQLARRNGRMAAVHFIDLDRFKVVNDTLGHSVGDALLQAVAQRLQSCLRASDTAARIGGDEFAVLQPEISSLDGAATLARKILAVMATTFPLAGRDIHISASIGVSVFPVDSNEPDQLLQNADMAMYLAKKEGRNNFQFFTPGLNAQIRDRLALESDLHVALERGEFVLHYQPQVNLRTRRLTGIEALIRWQHPKRGLVPPSLFISVAEECGLIHGLSRWVLERACAQNAEWQAAGLPRRRMAVNIASANFKHGDLCQSIADVLRHTELAPQYLELEVTETLLLQDEQVMAAIPKLKQMGVALSIDDFGTGYSSLNYLRRLPVSKLKIDQSFVRGLPTSQDDAIIAGAIIDLGHALGHTVIAEGIETEEQLAYLRDKRCDEGQGYLFGRPMTAEAFEALLKRERNSPRSQAATTWGAWCPA